MQSVRTYRRKLLFAICACIWGIAFAAPAHAQDNSVTLTPAVVEAGSPGLIHENASAAAALDGDWMGPALQFFPASNVHGWYAVAGVDVEGAVGPSVLRIRARPSGSGAAMDL